MNNDAVNYTFIFHALRLMCCWKLIYLVVHSLLLVNCSCLPRSEVDVLLKTDLSCWSLFAVSELLIFFSCLLHCDLWNFVAYLLKLIIKRFSDFLVMMAGGLAKGVLAARAASIISSKRWLNAMVLFCRGRAGTAATRMVAWRRLCENVSKTEQMRGEMGRKLRRDGERTNYPKGVTIKCNEME